MRIFLSALALAALAAGLLYPQTASASGTCGTTYRVKYRDTLSTIARDCQTTVEEILWLNPQITDPDLIFPRMELRLPAASTIPDPETDAITYTVQEDDALYDIAAMFGVTVAQIQAANPDLWGNRWIQPGQVLTIPERTIFGEPLVGFSTSIAAPFDKLRVYVSGFPPGALIDYRIAELDEDYSAVYDGVVGPDGSARMTITIPHEADDGEYWYIHVITTGQLEGTEAFSYWIYINE